MEAHDFVFGVNRNSHELLRSLTSIPRSSEKILLRNTEGCDENRKVVIEHFWQNVSQK